MPGVNATGPNFVAGPDRHGDFLGLVNTVEDDGDGHGFTSHVVARAWSEGAGCPFVPRRYGRPPISPLPVGDDKERVE